MEQDAKAGYRLVTEGVTVDLPDMPLEMALTTLHLQPGYATLYVLEPHYGEAKVYDKSADVVRVRALHDVPDFVNAELDSPHSDAIAWLAAELSIVNRQLRPS